MSYELIIDKDSKGEKIALLQDQKLIELQQNKSSKKFNVGDIYLGTVRKIMPNLNAAFVDIGHGKDAFLHYHDLGPNIRSLINLTSSTLQGAWKKSELDNFNLSPETTKTGKISEVVKKGMKLMVQIEKEPISKKGPRISAELSLAGKYFIIIPFGDTVTVSKKIGSSEERKRLKTLTHSIKPSKFTVICRTAAKNKAVKDLHQDLTQIFSKWAVMIESLTQAENRDKIYEESDKSILLLTDLLSYELKQIVTNDKVIYQKVKHFLQESKKNNALKNLKLHKGKETLFSSFKVHRQIQVLFGKKVPFGQGGYLIIEHTEAMHVIDVNSGNQKVSSDSSEVVTPLEINIEATKEIARQLRLRDMGGIIVIDYIDLKISEEKKILFENLKEAMSNDRAQHTILPMTKFGLVQITRQRVRPELNINTNAACPSCNGSGKIENTSQLIEDIEDTLIHLLQNQNQKKLNLLVHPVIKSYFTKGVISRQIQWFLSYRRWVKIKISSDFGLLEFKIFDSNEDEIKIQS
ncbi:MAG: ribonuclease E/G [Bacteroidetes bacterium MED-G17]|nr:MAG: ribonuclease E/G [Bacteroidetes bacterium MED-G17]CAI8270868.1 MAG: Ribonuclease G [Bacteroidetes bacterium MED-G17]